jgi:hypothetical protein
MAKAHVAFGQHLLKLVKTKNKVFNKSNTHVEGADLGYYASLLTAFLGISSNDHFEPTTDINIFRELLSSVYVCW